MPMLGLLKIYSNSNSFHTQVAAGLLNQSVDLTEVKAWWAKVWLVVWWLAAQNILVTVYTGILVSLLMVPAYPPKLHTLDDLANSQLT